MNAKRKPKEASLPDFDALLTKEQMALLEARGRGFGVNRRIVLAVLTRSRAQLIEGGDGDTPESVAEVLTSCCWDCGDCWLTTRRSKRHARTD
jgi:hypothetical protein